MPASGPPTFADVLAARERLRSLIERTPVVRDTALDPVLGCRAFLKCENRQPTGAFKLRGASNAVAALRAAGDDRDVATHSSGNHGAALALAARRDGRQAWVVMPRNSVSTKIEAVRRHGGKVVLCEPGQGPREAGLAELVGRGLVPIPPYEHPQVIAGQGTAAMELLEEVPDLDQLVMPLGGGGLLAGCLLAAESLAPDCAVFGVEPEGAADGHASLKQGRRVDSWNPDTMADGLRAVIGTLNFDLIQGAVRDILLVSEAEIESAMRLVLEATGMLIEPSSAVAVAAVRRHRERFEGGRTGIILTGGNVDRRQFSWLADVDRG